MLSLASGPALQRRTSVINFISNPNELWHSGRLVTDFLYVIMGGWIWH